MTRIILIFQISVFISSCNEIDQIKDTVELNQEIQDIHQSIESNIEKSEALLKKMDSDFSKYDTISIDNFELPRYDDSSLNINGEDDMELLELLKSAEDLIIDSI